MKYQLRPASRMDAAPYSDYATDELDFYAETNYEEQLESDGISSEEELFIQGYVQEM